MKYNDVSTIVSQIVTGIGGAAVAGLAIFLPKIVRFYEKLRPDVPTEFSLSLLYLILLAGAAAVVALWILLGEVRGGRVFTAKPVACLRVLSWSCIAAGILFGILGIHYLFSILVAVAALFLGLILRVLKNCLQEAVLIKEENDFTI